MKDLPSRFIRLCTIIGFRIRCCPWASAPDVPTCSALFNLNWTDLRPVTMRRYSFDLNSSRTGNARSTLQIILKYLLRTPLYRPVITLNPSLRSYLATSHHRHLRPPNNRWYSVPDYTAASACLQATLSRHVRLLKPSLVRFYSNRRG